MQPLGSLALAAVTGSLVGSLLLAGCSGDPDDPDARPTPPPAITSRGIDAASYVEDYEGAQSDAVASGSVSAGAPMPLSSSVRGTRSTIPQIPPIGPTVPGPLDDDTFVDAGTSGFVGAAQDALSTFALDVDTGSWGVARTLLRQGLLPPPA